MINIYYWGGNKDFDIAVSYQLEGKIRLQEELQRFLQAIFFFHFSAKYVFFQSNIIINY